MEKKEKVLAAADPGCGRVPVNKIIPFSAVDGPGNRTAVFPLPELRELCGKMPERSPVYG